MRNTFLKFGAVLICLQVILFTGEISGQCSPDNTPPTITSCAVTRNLEGCNTSVITGPVYSTTSATSSESEFENATNQGVASDECGITSVTYIDVASGTCPIIVTRTWSVTDAANHTTTCNQIINVDDNTAPTFTGSITTTNIAGCVVGDAPAAVTSVAALEGLTGNLLISDNCTANENLIVSSSQSSSGTCPIVLTRTYKVTDACGNTSLDIVHTININDTTAPSVTGPNAVELECSTAIPAAATNITQYLALTGSAASDNCTAQGSLSVSSSTGSLVGTECSGSITRTYTITDACGNTATANHVFNISDNTVPVVTAPTATELECSTALPAAATTIAQYLALSGSNATDNCTAQGSLTVSSSTGSLVGTECSGTITRTYTITDACGNTSTANHVFNVSDNTVPVWTTGANALNTNVECSDATGLADAQALFPVASDNCDSDVTNIVKTSGSYVAGGVCPQEGTYTNTWVVTDACGNTSAVFTQVITITDNTSPSITGPNAVELECSTAIPAAATNITQYLALTGSAASDNCTAQGSLSVSSSTGSLVGTECSGSITRTYTITDACGNTSTANHVFNVSDNTAPVVTAPTATELECSTAIPAAATTIAQYLALSGSNATDNCTAQGSLTVSSSTGSLVGTECSGTITRTYTITDACGNTSTANHVFNVSDNTVPVWTTGANALNTNVECGDATGLADAQALFPVASDNCDSDVTNIVKTSGSYVAGGTCAQEGTYTNTWVVTDACGNTSAVFMQVITITDNNAPVVTGTITTTTVEGCVAGDAPAAQTTVAGLETLAGDLDIEDACTVEGSLVVSSSQTTSGSCPVVITRTYKVTDACGNTSVDIVHTINVNNIGTLSAPSDGGSTVSCPSQATDPGAPAPITDACGRTVTATLVGSVSTPNPVTCEGTVVWTYRYTACDGTTTDDWTYTYTIIDDVEPTASNPQSIAIQCIADVPLPSIDVVTDEQDNCGVTPVVTFIGDSNNGGDGCQNSPFIVSRTYRVTDNCGNTINVVQTITAIDNTAPVVTAPTATELECSNAIPAAAATIAQYLALTGANATDNCTTQGSLAVSSTTGALVGSECTGTITRTYTITDACGNTSTANHVFNVSDNTASTASNPTAVNVQCIASVPAADITVVTDEADNCDATPTVTHIGDTNNGGTGCVASPYIVTRTYRVTDDCGNTVEVTQTITAVDNTAPVVTAPAATELECSTAIPAAATTIAQYLALTGANATDNCTAQGSLTISSTTGSMVGTNCNGTITRTYTIVDACGNATTANHVFNVSDDTPPTAQTPAPLGVQCISDIPAPNILTVLGELDNCDITPTVSFVSDSNNGGSGCSGSPYIVTRTYSITDDCDNTAYVVQTITAIDNTAPVVTAPATTELECSTTLPAAATTIAEFLALTGANATDNCTAQGSLTVSSTTGTLVGSECTGTITRTYTITDACGNTSTANHVFNVSDNTAPTASNPAPISVQCIVDVPVPDVSVVVGEADNCDATPTVTHLSDSNNGGTGCTGSPYIVTRTYRVTDDCGNTTNVVQTITAVDNTAPVVTAPAATELECSTTLPGAATTITEYLTIAGSGATDNCTAQGSLIVTSVTGGLVGTECTGTITRTYTITDACGNATTANHVFNVSDNTAPTASNPAPIGVQCIADVPIPDVLVVIDEGDNCDATPTVTHLSDSNNGGSGCAASPYIVTRTYRVTDDCGNTINVVQTITAIDNIAPVVTGTITATTVEGCDASYAPAAQTTVAGLESLLGDLEISDACTADGSLVVTSSQTTSGTCPVVITRTYRVTDACGNTSVDIIHTINVDDTQAPTFTAPSNTTILKDASCNYNANPSITGDVTNEADNCDATLNATFSDAVANGSCQGQSIITRTWSLTDDCGNITTHTQTITALDVTAPVLTAPTATEIECSTAIPAAATTIAQFLALPGANAIDACAIQSSLMVSSTTGPLTGTQCNGSITRTYSISDPCGNVSFIDHVFNVSDNTAPVPVAGTILACYQSQALAEAAAIANTTATDNCTGSLTFTAATTDGPDCDSTITVTVTDACGNTATVSYQTQINCQPVQLKVFLEGPYDPVNNNLKTTLNNDHLLPGQNTSLLFVGDTPSGQPYNDAPWNYNGNTGMNFGDPPYGTIPYPTDVVDWILVTVRQDGILPANNIWTCAGWVHSDGNVSFPEECPMPAIEITSDYYILVQHRNHLGILSPSFVNIECGGTILRWDFTTSDSYKPAFRVGQKQIEPGVWGMFGSNGEQVNSIATINSPDRTRWRSQQGMTGYLKGDYDLNRSANSADETKWKINQNKTSGIIFY